MASLKPQMRIRVSNEVKEWLDKKAANEQRSVSFLVNQVIERAMKEKKEAA